MPDPAKEEELVSDIPETRNSASVDDTPKKDWVSALLPDSVVATMDQQRLERLHQCRSLQDALKECRQQQHHDEKTLQTPANKKWRWWPSQTTINKDQNITPQQQRLQQLEDFPMGIRMVRYFQWRNMTEHEPCLREQHALWACRAVALQCGADLIRVRDCFRNEGPATILSQEKTGYEETYNGKGEGRCFDVQRGLGQCVSRNAVALKERIQKRKGEEKNELSKE